MLEGLCEAAHEFAAARKWRAIDRVPEARVAIVDQARYAQIIS
jgi:hypothetical protein